MIWGFTGTSRGVTEMQYAAMAFWLDDQLREHPILEFHHGDCIGADATFHGLIVKALGDSLRYRIIKHPCTIESKRAYCTGGMLRSVRPPLVRNQFIVLESDALLACPAEDHEIIRSGTWATIRCALRNNIPVTIIWPDGRIEEGWRRQTA